MKRREPEKEVIVKMTGQKLAVHHIVELNDYKYPNFKAGTVICKNPKWVPTPEPQFLVFESFQVEKAQYS